MQITQRKIRAKKVTGEQIIKAARRYIGTPYGHQGQSKEILDCGGLLIVVCRDLKILDMQVAGYSPNPDGYSFEGILNEYLTEILPKEDVRLGYILAHDYGKGVQHTSIVSACPANGDSYLKVIHAKRKFGVCEQRLFGTEDAKGWVKTYKFKSMK